MEAMQHKAAERACWHRAGHRPGMQGQEELTCRGRLNASCTAGLRGGDNRHAGCSVRVGVGLPEEHVGTAASLGGQYFKSILLYGLALTARKEST